MINEILNFKKKTRSLYSFFENLLLFHFKINDNIINRLVEKQKKHGDSWIEKSIFSLKNRVNEMFRIYKEKENINDLEQKGLLDLINQCILLLIRLKQKENYLKEYE